MVVVLNVLEEELQVLIQFLIVQLLPEVEVEAFVVVLLDQQI